METNARRQILATTSRLLEAQGYHGTGLNQIIKESGAPRGSLYYYFPAGKEELAAAAIAQKGADMGGFTAQLLAEVDDPVAAIDYFLRNLIAHTQGSRYCSGAPLAAVALETAATSPRLQEACAAAYDDLRRPFYAKLLAGGYGEARAGALATLIVAALEGGVTLSRAQQSSAPLEQVRAEVLNLLGCAAQAVAST